MADKRQRRDLAARLARMEQLFTEAEPAGVGGQFIVPVTGDRLMYPGTTAVALGGQYVKLPNGLVLPASAAKPPQPLDHAHVYLTMEEALGERSSFPDLIGLLQRLPRGEVLLFCAMWLGRSGSPRAVAETIDVAYLAQFAPGELRQRLTNLAAKGRRRVTAPQALTALMKLAFLFCPADGDPSLNASETLPLVPLAVADHLTPQDFTDAEEVPSDTSALAREMVSNQHFNAPNDVAHVVGRWVRQWRQMPRESPVKGLGPLDDLYEEATGVSMDDVATVALSMWASAVSGRPWLLPQFFDSLGIPEDRVSAARHLLGASPPEMLAALRYDYQQTGFYGLRWEFSSFGRYPVVCGDDGTLVLDPRLLIARAFGWLPFFDVEDYLRKRNDRRLGPFRNAVRHFAEEYVLEVLRSLAPDVGGSRRVYCEEDLKRAYGRPGVKIADAAVDYGDAWVVLDVSTRRLMRNTVAGVSDEALTKDIQRLAVEKAEQLESTINQLRLKEEQLTGRPSQGGRRFIPVVVAAEGFPVNPITSVLIEERLRERGVLQQPDTLPLQVLDVVELEMVEGLQEAGGPSLAELLTAKPGGALHRCSLRDYVLMERRLPARRPNRLDRLWLQPFDHVADRLRPVA